MFNDIGLTRGVGQYVGVVTVLAISATSIFLMRQYFLSIPRDLEEAARIDGAGFFTTFWRVMLPLAGPALAAVAILQFQGTWNSFFWPVILLQDPDHYTLPLGLLSFVTSGGFSTNWPPLMAVGRDGDHPDPDPLHLLPALLRRRDRGEWRQGLRSARVERWPTVGSAIRAALGDFYVNSVRLVVANLLWGATWSACGWRF